MPESTRGKNYLLLSKQHSKEHPDNVILFSDKIYVCVCVCVCVYELSSHEKTWRKLECILLSEAIYLKRLYTI